jgi:hypothetical protein
VAAFYHITLLIRDFPMKPMSVVFSVAMIIFSSSAYSERSCFHGWLPTDLNDSVTGFCWNRQTDPDVGTDIHIEVESQKTNIRGVLGWGQGSRFEWFDYATTSCKDISETQFLGHPNVNRQRWKSKLGQERQRLGLYPSLQF